MSNDYLEEIFGTEDQTQTFLNKKYNEAYHSFIGPIIEAKHKFIHPSSLKDFIFLDKEIKILDLFFGLGYNSGIAIDYAYNLNNKVKIHITAIEIDSEIINKISLLKVPEWYEKWKLFLSNLSSNNFIQYENIKINLILEDVKNALNYLNEKFDVIFFDPFSFKSTPEFWEEEFLLKILSLLNPRGSFSTYSSLKKLENLAIKNNFIVEKISPIGRKKHSLVIKKN